MAKSWQEGLNRCGGSQFTNCIDRCMERLRIWNKVEFMHVGKKIANLQKKLQVLEAYKTSRDTEKEIKEVQYSLNVWLDAESTMWNERS